MPEVGRRHHDVSFHAIFGHLLPYLDQSVPTGRIVVASIAVMDEGSRKEGAK